MCWDLKHDCMAKAEGEAKRPCPSFEQKKICWELDWTPFLQKVSNEQKEMMGKWLKENCPKCPVYDMHQAEIDAKISTICRKLFISISCLTTCVTLYLLYFKSLKFIPLLIFK